MRPRAGELDESEAFPTELYQEMAALGLFGITVPAEYGGAGLDTLSYALVMEELSRGYASVADQCGLVELIGTLLSVHGSDAQRQMYLGDVARRPQTRGLLHHRGRGRHRCFGHQDDRQARRRLAGGSPAPRCGSTMRRLPISPMCWRAQIPQAGNRGMSIFIVDLSVQGRLARQEGKEDGPARLACRCAAFRRGGAARRRIAGRSSIAASTS